MAVYVDEAIWHWHGRKWCHLLADSEAELHRFAFSLGVQRSSYQGPPRTGKPHYDLTAWERSRAISRGAIPCDRQQIIAVLRQVRGQVRGRARPLVAAAEMAAG
ncbi:DUF4031 domain-containing protein [Microbaculum marinisediminis]|uniref:DUF4031 domain-containing protein n=1 Tax=Microbaculum marinisediminis TaxID=2931392 RepID=A0AAW5R0S8_9HYPH|nr:DUF4031 domain-containing protein [Microbaculum sp. A6E488]MCT8972777.1 DUF4031 domain-containing protein [Microbaculum sp. A6E488]